MRNGRRTTRKCDHTGAVKTVIAGIQRTVCEVCGDVTIDYDHVTCTHFPNETGEAWEDFQANALSIAG